MKSKFKNIACFLITAILTFSMLMGLGKLLRPVNTDLSTRSIRTYHDLPKDTVEVIGYGSSHMWRGFNPMVLYSNYGIGAYNYGGSWQHLNTTKLFFEESLQTQSPKLILIETYTVNDLFHQDSPVNGEIYYTRELNYTSGLWDYLHQCFGNDKDKYLAYFLPLAAFHSNWTNINYSSFYGSQLDVDMRTTMGFYAVDEATPIDTTSYPDYPQSELTEESIEILDDIVRVCREQNIEILFYTAPYGLPYEFSDAMAEYARNNGYTYLNLFDYVDEMDIDLETDFYDLGHLNTSGANKISDFLGEYIVTHYDVTDMRNIEGNIWETYMALN